MKAAAPPAPGRRVVAPASPAASERVVAPVAARAGRRVWSIRWIATGVTVLLTTLAVVSVGVVADRNAGEALDRELQSRTLLLARNLALTSSGALLGEFPELTLQPVVRRLLDQQPELAFAAVVNHEGRVQAHPDARRLGTAFAPEPDLVPIAPAGAPPGGAESLRGDREALLADVPVYAQDGTRVIGRAFVSLRRDYIERALAASRRQQAFVTLVFLAAGVAVAFVLMSGLLRPVAALRAGLQRIGRGDLDSPIELRDRTEIGLLAETVNDMTRALRQAQSEMVERERLGREMELAREIQQSLLPARPVLAAPFLLRGDQRAAAEVGGDYFDILTRADGRVAIAVADVAGKGLAGCLVMAMLSALLRALRDRHDSPADMLAALDERLGESLRPGVFVTMFYGILDPASGRLVYASAGHNPLLVRRRGRPEVEVLTSKGIPLAAIRGGTIRRTLRDQEVRLEPGDVALQYTDGYTEAFAPASREEFGLERVTRVLESAGAEGADAVLAQLRGALAKWTGGTPPDDDETLLVVSAELGSPAAAPRPEAAAAVAPAGLPVEILRRAEAGGIGLELEPSHEALAAIRPWLATIPGLHDLGRDEADWLGSALYEACANIAEHGYANRPARAFQLWWLAGSGESPSGADAGARSSHVLRHGSFVIRDDGTAFRPDTWKASDFSDPSVRRRGRGIGLDIIHNVMRGVGYHPGTARGNITVLAFGPKAAGDTRKEAA